MPRYFDPNFPKYNVQRVTIYGNVLTLSGGSGTANITIGGAGVTGFINPTIATFATDLTTTANNWITNNYNYYYALGYVCTAAAGVITVTPRYGWDSTNRISITIANVSGALNGTLAGTFSPDFSKAKNWLVTFGQNITVAAPIGMKEGDNIHLELAATGAYTVTWATNAYFFAGGTEPTQTSTALDAFDGVFNKVNWPRQDVITLSGSSGTATIAYAGLSYTSTWNTSLTQTAADFVTANSAAFLLKGITLTAASGVLYFTSSSAIKATEWFGKATIANASGTLNGAVVTRPAGRFTMKVVAQNIIQ
jgi:hypothetical protein